MKPTAPKHTPGPWTFRPGLFRKNSGDSIGFIQTQNGAMDLIAPPCMSPEFYANARLIAAAPELLDSLGANTRLLQLVAPLLRDGPHVAKIKFLEEQIALNSALISKAEGNA